MVFASRKTGLRTSVLDHADTLEDHPLLEEPPPPGRIERAAEASHQGVRDPGIEEVEARMSDQPGPWTGAPGLETKADQRVFENLVVLLNRPGGEGGVAPDRREVDGAAALGCRHVQEPADPPQVAHEGLGLDLLAKIRLRVAFEKIARVGVGSGDDGGQAAEPQGALQVEGIALLRHGERVQSSGGSPPGQQVRATTSQFVWLYGIKLITGSTPLSRTQREAPRRPP